MIVLPGFVMSFNANRSDISGDSSESMVEGDCIDVLFHTRVMRYGEKRRRSLDPWTSSWKALPRDGDKHSQSPAFDRTKIPSLSCICPRHCNIRPSLITHCTSIHVPGLDTRVRAIHWHRHRPWPTQENLLLTRASGREYRTAVMTTCISRYVRGGQVVSENHC
jgi:hypothetical protein